MGAALQHALLLLLRHQPCAPLVDGAICEVSRPQTKSLRQLHSIDNEQAVRLETFGHLQLQLPADGLVVDLVVVLLYGSACSLRRVLLPVRVQDVLLAVQTVQQALAEEKALERHRVDQFRVVEHKELKLRARPRALEAVGRHREAQPLPCAHCEVVQEEVEALAVALGRGRGCRRGKLHAKIQR
eukprot:scaffold455_cov155-Ochromonas_danica.AAC.13